ESPISIVIEIPTQVPTAVVNPTATLVPPPDTLVVCLNEEPDSLYAYGSSSQAAKHIWQAIYDGPIDSNGYRYEPVILEKIPSLRDGDGAVNLVTVTEGDRVVDDSGTPAELTPGTIIRPSGCNSGDCAFEYDEGDLLLDQMQVTFRILRGVVWSDGTPLTAQDSVYSFELNASDETPASKFVVDRTASYSAVDDFTVIWQGLPGYIDPNYGLNFWTPMPEHIWGSMQPGTLLNAKISTEKPIGWGPYTIQSWNPGQNIILQKNPNYFRSTEGLPHFEQLVFRFVGENTNNNIAATMSGECDVVEKVENIAFTTLAELQNNGRLNTIVGQKATWEHLDFGINPASYDDGYDPGDDRPAFFSDTRTRQ
ncbi:MAG: ABC transporter substrate-binding protein, partial [Chloroflexota bacterium]